MKDKVPTDIKPPEIKLLEYRPDDAISEIHPELQAVIDAFRATFKYLKKGYIISWLDFRYIEVSPNISEYIWVTREKLLNKLPSEISVSEQEKVIIKQLQDTIEWKPEYSIEFQVKIKDTWDTMILEKVTQAILDSKWKIIGILSVFTDITDEKLQEKSFRESQNIWMVWTYNVNFVLKKWEWSDVLYKIFGIDDKIERNIDLWFELIHPDDREMMHNYLQDILKWKIKKFDKQYRIIRKDNWEIRWVHWLGTIEFDTENNAISMDWTIIDITVQKRLEKEKADLEKLIEQLKSVLDNIKKIKEARSVVSEIAPKYSENAEKILENLEKLRPVLKKTENIQLVYLCMEACKKILSNTEVLQELTENKEYEKTSIDIYKSIQNIFSLFNITGSKIKTKIYFHEKEFFIDWNELLIGKIFMELIKNSASAINDKWYEDNIENWIKVKAENYTVIGIDKTGLPSWDYVHIKIKDTWKWMSKDEVKRSFDILYTTKPESLAETQGVWLSRVLKYINDLGGSVDIESIEWVWTTINIYLQRTLSQLKQNLNRWVRTMWDWEKILIVTDNQDNLKTLKQLLLLQNFTPIFVSDKNEGLELIKETKDIKLVMVESLHWENKMIIRSLEKNKWIDNNIFSSINADRENEITIDKQHTQPLVLTIRKILDEKM